MSDTADLDALAERYLDLWQDQMSALASDPEFAEVMNRLVASSAAAMPEVAAAWAAWPAMMAALLPGAAGGRRENGKGAQQAEESAGRAGTGDKGGAQAARGPARAKAAASAPRDRGADLVELARRIAALEQRVADLESGPGKGRRSARGGSRKARA
jgi:hypothetical protein